MSKHSSNTDDDEVDLRDVFRRLWSQKWRIAATTVSLTAAFIVTTFVMTPVYRAATVLVASGSDSVGAAGGLSSALGSLASVASLVGIGLGGSGDQDEAIAVLTSREFVQKFIEDKGLMPLLYDDDWDAGKKRWKHPDDAPTPAKAYKDFLDDNLSVSQDRKTNLVTVTIDWRDREQAAAWANELVARLNAEMRRRALEQAEAALGYLKDELKVTTQVGVQDAINQLIEAQINKRMLANVTEEYAFRVVDKALPPDEDDPERPKKLLMAAVGLLMGLLTGAVWALLRTQPADRP
ncbi:MAG: hypothetical protein JSR15_07115 [Proteobacteria bacterium]|nr:hypothetical protein [Pseudomonadota bacterium]